MKSSKSVLVRAITLLALLAMIADVAAQDEVAQANKPKHHRYKLIDIGTFGGPASYLTCCSPAFRVLNNRATVAGYADTPTPDPYPGFCFNPDCYVSHAFQWQNGVLTDLGTLPGGSSSQSVWISTNGLITGNSQNGEIDPLVPGFPENRAVLWKDGTIIDLGTLEGGLESFTNQINSRGQIVGFFDNTIPDPFSFLGLQLRAFLWQEGVMQDLGTLGGPDAGATNVNERGQVAGLSYTNSTPNPVTGIPTQDPFLWEKGKMLDLGTLGGTVGFPNDLNNAGQVIGRSNLPGDLTYHPFLWENGKMLDLGTFGGNGYAAALNDAGEVVGQADLPGDQMWHGFLWRHGVMTDLGTVVGDTCSGAIGIGSKGQVVGASGMCFQTARASLWENGGPMIDLNALIPPNSDLHLSFAENINDRGEIAGIGVVPGSGCADVNAFDCGHAFLLIPCDEKHYGVCEDDSMIEGASRQTSAPAAMEQGSESSARVDTPSHNRFGRGFHIPGRPAAPRD